MKEWLVYLPLVLLLAVLLGYLGYLGWKSWKRLDELELKDRFAARNDFIKTTAQILGGAFFLFGLYFTWANLVATQEKNRNEFYFKAIEQFGSEKPGVRLVGIYTLEDIARESPKHHWIIMEVLTDFVRENAPVVFAFPGAVFKDPAAISQREVPIQPGEPTRDKKPELRASIQAALTVLGRTAITYRQKGEKRTLDLHAVQLPGADLIEANLQGANLIHTNLQMGVLSGANFKGAVLREAKLQDSVLSYANLDWADLRQANLQGANLQGANLQGAKLQGANLQETSLIGANFHGASLQGANLQGSDFQDSEGLTNEQVAQAVWDETTRWPKGFSPPLKAK